MSLKEDILQVIGGEHVAALATVQGDEPAVRFMVMTGQADLSIVGATMKATRKVEQINRNPKAALTIWSGKSFADPYVIITGIAQIHEDQEAKEKYWDPNLEAYFRSPDNPDYVVIKLVPRRIEYYHDMTVDVWEG